ncbi:hypothetical protein BC831DRAFT_514054 [Entophlyctis helioformis]|nr:hypothetical protein BC831DRAFT_514054 [Entophlyctis helioformis]
MLEDDIVFDADALEDDGIKVVVNDAAGWTDDMVELGRVVDAVPLEDDDAADVAGNWVGVDADDAADNGGTIELVVDGVMLGKVDSDDATVGLPAADEPARDVVALDGHAMLDVDLDVMAVELLLVGTDDPARVVEEMAAEAVETLLDVDIVFDADALEDDGIKVVVDDAVGWTDDMVKLGRVVDAVPLEDDDAADVAGNWVGVDADDDADNGGTIELVVDGAVLGNVDSDDATVGLPAADEPARDVVALNDHAMLDVDLDVMAVELLLVGTDDPARVVEEMAAEAVETLLDVDIVFDADALEDDGIKLGRVVDAVPLEDDDAADVAGNWVGVDADDAADNGGTIELVADGAVLGNVDSDDATVGLPAADEPARDVVALDDHAMLDVDLDVMAVELLLVGTDDPARVVEEMAAEAVETLLDVDIVFDADALEDDGIKVVVNDAAGWTDDMVKLGRVVDAVPLEDDDAADVAGNWVGVDADDDADNGGTIELVVDGAVLGNVDSDDATVGLPAADEPARDVVALDDHAMLDVDLDVMAVELLLVGTDDPARVVEEMAAEAVETLLDVDIVFDADALEDDGIKVVVNDAAGWTDGMVKLGRVVDAVPLEDDDAADVAGNWVGVDADDAADNGGTIELVADGAVLGNVDSDDATVGLPAADEPARDVVALDDHTMLDVDLDVMAVELLLVGTDDPARVVEEMAAEAVETLLDVDIVFDADALEDDGIKVVVNDAAGWTDDMVKLGRVVDAVPLEDDDAADVAGNWVGVDADDDADNGGTIELVVDGAVLGNVDSDDATVGLPAADEPARDVVALDDHAMLDVDLDVMAVELLLVGTDDPARVVEEMAAEAVETMLEDDIVFDADALEDDGIKVVVNDAAGWTDDMVKLGRVVDAVPLEDDDAADVAGNWVGVDADDDADNGGTIELVVDGAVLGNVDSDDATVGLPAADEPARDVVALDDHAMLDVDLDVMAVELLLVGTDDPARVVEEMAAEAVETLLDVDIVFDADALEDDGIKVVVNDAAGWTDGMVKLGRVVDAVPLEDDDAADVAGNWVGVDADDAADNGGTIELVADGAVLGNVDSDDATVGLPAADEPARDVVALDDHAMLDVDLDVMAVELLLVGTDDPARVVEEMAAEAVETLLDVDIVFDADALEDDGIKVVVDDAVGWTDDMVKLGRVVDAVPLEDDDAADVAGNWVGVDADDAADNGGTIELVVDGVMLDKVDSDDATVGLPAADEPARDVVALDDHAMLDVDLDVMAVELLLVGTDDPARVVEEMAAEAVETLLDVDIVFDADALEDDGIKVVVDDAVGWTDDMVKLGRVVDAVPLEDDDAADVAGNWVGVDADDAADNGGTIELVVDGVMLDKVDSDDATVELPAVDEPARDVVALDDHAMLDVDLDVMAVELLLCMVKLGRVVDAVPLEDDDAADVAGNWVGVDADDAADNGGTIELVADGAVLGNVDSDDATVGLPAADEPARDVVALDDHAMLDVDLDVMAVELLLVGTDDPARVVDVMAADAVETLLDVDSVVDADALEDIAATLFNVNVDVVDVLEDLTATGTVVLNNGALDLLVAVLDIVTVALDLLASVVAVVLVCTDADVETCNVF